MKLGSLFHKSIISLLALLIVLSCDDEKLEDNCAVISTRVTTPYDFELFYYPYIELEINGLNQYILQDKMITNVAGTCPDYGPDCIVAALYTYPGFFQIHFSRAQTYEDMQGSVGKVTPLISLDSILEGNMNIVHMGFTLYDKCENSYHPSSNQSGTNVNVIENVELINWAPLDKEKGVDLIETLVYGHMGAQYDVRGERLEVKMKYKFRHYITQVN